MNKLNLPPFYVGQKVIYVTGNNMQKNSTHTVTCVRKSCCCGDWEMQINNQPIFITKQKTILHCDCGKQVLIGAGFEVYWDCKSFRAIEQQKFPLIKLSKIVEVEKEEVLIEN